jgi:hypothetical protein
MDNILYYKKYLKYKTKYLEIIKGGTLQQTTLPWMIDHPLISVIH